MSDRLDDRELANALNVQPDELQRRAIMQVIDDCIDIVKDDTEDETILLSHVLLANSLGGLKHLKNLKQNLERLYENAPKLLGAMDEADEDEDKPQRSPSY